MDSKEFKAWTDRLKVLFPKFKEWLGNLDVKYRNEVSAEWERALFQVEFVDATEALTAIHTGDAEPFNQWEYGTWIAHVRKIATTKRLERTHGYEQPTTWGNDQSGPRFNCWKCQDSGFVSVWHVVTMQAIIDGEELTPRLLKTMATICNCEVGRAKITPDEGKKKRRVWTEEHVYDPLKHCLCLNGQTDKKSVAKLRDFVATAQKRHLVSHPSYSETLAQYNKGSEF